MQDIDFDEIDRAVNSTMKPRSEPKKDDSVVSVNVSRSERSESAPAARRSSGRFMDVVHPSSDMRSTTSERSTPRPAVEKPETPLPSHSSSDWPDPLDFHGFNPDLPKKEASDQDAQPVKPLESPFISDAKVEKRPLGAFSEEKPAEIEKPKEEETPLLEAPDEPLLEAENKEEISEPKPEIVSESLPAQDEIIAPVSITQQYKEQPSTDDQPSGAIFDTEAYHQPLAHPEKKRSGALIVIWIFVLILLGAGIGAGVYFYVLPLL